MKELILKFIGRDSWDKPVYEADGKLYVDIDPLKKRTPNICTKSNNEFYGEPDIPIGTNIQIKFEPCRDTWD